MPRRPTIADLSRASGVSVATVDRMLNRRLPVSQASAMLVAAAAEAIGFHAAGLLKKRVEETPQRTFGFVLQKRNDAFYQAVAAALIHATKSTMLVRGKPLVAFVDDLVPAAIAEKIREVGKNADALAVVAIDHPYVVEAIAEQAQAGVSVLALLSDVPGSARAGYIGLDSARLGRIAAWTIARMAKSSGPVGVLVGTRRYRGQDLAEASFRNWFKAHAPDFRLLETHVDLEDDRIACHATLELLARADPPCGIYLAGGGMKGMIAALREGKRTTKAIVVCNELLPVTRAALLDGVVDLVLSTPLAALAAQTIDAMICATGGAAQWPEITHLPADIFISENV